MTKIIFLVQGSASKPYEVTFEKAEDNVRSFCSCPAGENGQSCKHRKNIIAGNQKGIVSNNAAESVTVSLWYKNSPAEDTMKEIEEKERQIETLTKEVQALRKKLSKVL